MISVIICTYNRSASLRVTLQSLQKMHRPPDLTWELIVVDNNSRDDTKHVIDQYRRTAAFDVRYVFESKQGHSHARNRGVEASKGGVLAFTDDDVTVDAYWLEEIRHTYEHFDCLGLGGRIVPIWRCPRPAWLHETGRYALMKAIVSFDHGEAASSLKTPPFGANMSFSRAAFSRYGLFRTDLGRIGKRLRGADDTEFGARLMRNNERLIYNPRAVIYHHVDHERATRSYFQRWYFEYGRTSVQLTGTVPTGVVGRVRPHMTTLRSLATNLARWATARDPQQRFYFRLHAFESLGRIRQLSGFTRDDVTVPRLSGAPNTAQPRDRRLSS